MVKRPKGLGRGLDALLGGNDEADKNAAAAGAMQGVAMLPVTALQPGKYQPRTRMDETALAELADSIRVQGLMQPILVRAVSADKYEIIAGERRWRAAQMAQLTEVPVLIRQVADENAAAMSLIENIQREDLNALEAAQGVQRLIQDFSYTHEQAAAALGKSRSATSNLLRLLNLAKPVQTMLMASDLDMGHARALLAVDGATQITLANQVVTKRLSVRETEKLVAKVAADFSLTPSRNRSKPAPDRDITRLAEELSETLGMPASIKPGKKGSGKLVIDYHSHEALDTLVAKLR
jgi:ParB family transcriptional regulator, chromosome partitioning protein